MFVFSRCSFLVFRVGWIHRCSSSMLFEDVNDSRSFFGVLVVEVLLGLSEYSCSIAPCIPPTQVQIHERSVFRMIAIVLIKLSNLPRGGGGRENSCFVLFLLSVGWGLLVSNSLLIVCSPLSCFDIK